LETVHIEDVIRNLGKTSPTLITAVDQGTDPRNIGAILRSAAAFGSDAVVVPDRHAPEVTGVMAKAASGAVDAVPLVRVTNLSRALEQLREAGFWTVGLDGEGKDTMDKLEWPARGVLVLGSEGKGLRRLTREHCDFLVRIPMTSAMESLNLSNAAAIALYEAYRQRNHS
jgi:23S rRNA (guanosine2251-2'-O)-methyltransferase